MRVLVTGGAGFIGRRLCRALLDAGHEVRVADRAPGAQPAGCEVVEGDLVEPAVCAAAVDGVDVVSHQAARVGMERGCVDGPAYAADNDLATATLLAALGARSFRGRLVLASSMVVYGEGRYACDEHGVVPPPARRAADLDAGRFEPGCPVCDQPLAWAAVPEDAPLRPRSIYATGKAAQEHLAGCFAREVGASVVALRYHNVYGPGLPLDTPYAGVAALWRTSLARGEAPRVFEDGGQTRDFVHVDDVAAANVAAIEASPDDVADARAGTADDVLALNVCSGRPVRILEVAEALVRAAGAGPALAPVVTGSWRAGDVRHVVASPERAAAVLGFRAAIGLDEGLATLADG